LAEKEGKISFFLIMRKMQRLLYQYCIFFLDLNKRKSDYAFLLGENKCLYQKIFSSYLWDVPNDKMEFTSLLMMIPVITDWV
jgi:hypothetical protein